VLNTASIVALVTCNTTRQAVACARDLTPSPPCRHKLLVSK
jgi:hypothetical protein